MDRLEVVRMYVQLGIGVALLVGRLTEVAKVVWVVTGTSHNPVALTMGQVAQGVFIVIPLGMCIDGLYSIREYRRRK